MADVEILPDWAARYIQENLSEHMHVINVLPIDKGAHSGAYLINTSKGAVLVQKGRMSEVAHWFMPLPGEHVAFRCDMCGEAMELVDPEVPRTVYCSSCGRRHYLVIQDGALRVVTRQEATDGAAGYKHGDYTLFHGGGRYFFAKQPPSGAAPAQLPDGHAVETNPRTGLPVLVATVPALVDNAPAPIDPASASVAVAAPSGAGAEPAYYQYRGDVHDVIDVEGIGQTYTARLKEVGVETTARLLYEDAASLASRIEVNEKTVRSWQAMAELMLVSGVGKQYAEALVRAGIDGIQALKAGDAQAIAEQVMAHLASLDTNVLGQKVTARRVEGWQAAAASMRRVKSKVPRR